LQGWLWVRKKLELDVNILIHAYFADPLQECYFELLADGMKGVIPFNQAYWKTLKAFVLLPKVASFGSPFLRSS
jgi:hypothetical protein